MVHDYAAYAIPSITDEDKTRSSVINMTLKSKGGGILHHHSSNAQCFTAHKPCEKYYNGELVKN